jgi:hypothetical protein
MKTLPLVFLLATNIAIAEQVTTTGYGKTCDAAVANAKVNAVDQVASAFILGESSVKDNTYREDIQKYSGGVLNRYNVVSTVRGTDSCTVTIQAEVEPKKDNRVVRSKSITPDFQEFGERVKVADRLDNVGNAIVAVIENPRWNIGREISTLTADVTMSFQPKWVSDVHAFSSVINEEGKVTSSAYANAHGSVVNFLMAYSPFAAVALHEVAQPKYVELSNQMMVCFAEYHGNNTDCRNIGVSFDNIPRSPKLLVVATDNTGAQYIMYQHFLDMKMYEFIQAGESKSMRWMTRIKNTYHQPALLVYTKETQSMKISFDVDNKFAKNIQSIKVYLK